jgi:ribonuclease HI
MSKPLLVACDGSALRKADGKVGGPIGWAWAREDGHWMSNGWFVGTNQRAELHAIRSVLLFHPKGHIQVQMDSQYALNTTKTWSINWARRGWTKADNKPIINLDIVKQIYALTQKRTDPIEYVWVKGHKTDGSSPLNVAADLRAGEASQRAKKSNKPDFNLYLDSKARTQMDLETDMLRFIMNQK